MARVTYESVLKSATPTSLSHLEQQGVAWYRDQMRQIAKTKFNKRAFIANSGSETVRRLEIGKLYLMEYIPKYSGIGDLVEDSRQLGVWDRYPLILPFEIAPNGFYALNLHYLPIRLRAILLDQLLGTANIPANKLRVNWSILKRFSLNRYGKFATHRYLLNHITSPFRVVKIDDYPKVIMLPIASWYGNDRALVNRYKRMI